MDPKLKQKPTRSGRKIALEEFHAKAPGRTADATAVVPGQLMNRTAHPPIPGAVGANIAPRRTPTNNIDYRIAPHRPSENGIQFNNGASINGVSRPRDNGPIYLLPETNDMGMLTDDPRTCHEAGDDEPDVHELMKANMQFYSGQDDVPDGRGYKTGYVPTEIQEESRRNRPRQFPDVNLVYGVQDNYVALRSRARSTNSTLENGQLVFPIYDGSDVNQPGGIGTVSPLANIIEVRTDKIRAPAFAIPGERVYMGIEELQDQSIKLQGGLTAHFVFEATDASVSATSASPIITPNAIDLIPLLDGKYVFQKPMRLDSITLAFVVDGKRVQLYEDEFTGIITQTGALAAATQWVTPVLVKTFAALPTYVQAGAGIGATLTAGAAGVLAIDGVILAQGDRILVDQIGAAAPSDAGIYVFTNATNNVGDTWVLTRATDFDETAEVLSGTGVSVTGGDRGTGTAWQLTTADPIVVDTTGLTFVVYSHDVIITTQTPHNLTVGDQVILTDRVVIKTPTSTVVATDFISQADLTALEARRGYLITSIPSPTQFTIPVDLTDNAAFPVEEPTFFGKVNGIGAFATNVGAPLGKTIIQTDRPHGYGGLPSGQSALFILTDWFTGDPSTDALLNITANLTTVDIPAANQITIPAVPTSLARLQYNITIFNRRIDVALKFRSVVQETTNYVVAV